MAQPPSLKLCRLISVLRSHGAAPGRMIILCFSTIGHLHSVSSVLFNFIRCSEVNLQSHAESISFTSFGINSYKSCGVRAIRLFNSTMATLAAVGLHPLTGFLPSKSYLEVNNRCFTSQPEDQGLSAVAGGVVALGKFDALHIGHRELAIQASRFGAPFLVSFVGIAEVLGWEPRAPIVAKYDRERVLSSWAPLCGNQTPKEVEMEFAAVRHLTPTQFVEKMSKELNIRGVVAGCNYRFGYKAEGDGRELVRLCKEYGLEAHVINHVMDEKHSLELDGRDQGQVSSTRVLRALASGDMKYVSDLLGRPHRLMVKVHGKVYGRDGVVFVPNSCLLNMPPGVGVYEKCGVFIGEMQAATCRVVIGRSGTLLEMNGCLPSPPQGMFGVEFWV